jgi:hypothetical protein
MNAHVGLRVVWWVMVVTAAIGIVSAAFTFGEMQNPLLLFPVAAETVVGASVARQRPSNPMGWVFLGIGTLAGTLSLAVVTTSLATRVPGEVPWWGFLAAWVSAWAWYPLLFLLTTVTLLLFPSGLLSPRWRPVLWLSTLSAVGITLVAALVPTVGVEFSSGGEVIRSVPNPFSPPFMANVSSVEDSALAGFFGLLFLVGLLVSVVSSALRVKRSRGIEREQMRWFGFAVALIVLLVVFEATLGRFVSPSLTSIAEVLVLSFFVVSCGVAILRYRLYDIDRIISRTTSYLVVTGSLIAVYAVTVAAASELVSGRQPLAVAAATLLVAAVFRPLLRRVRRVVDRRFDREHYDAELAIGEFADRLRVSSDEGVVQADLESVVQLVFQPAGVGVWLRAGLVPSAEGRASVPSSASTEMSHV